MTNWANISDLRMTPAFQNPTVTPDGLNAVAIDIFFKAQDSRGQQLAALPIETLRSAVTLIEANTGDLTPIPIISGGWDFFPADFNQWFCSYDTSHLSFSPVHFPGEGEPSTNPFDDLQNPDPPHFPPNTGTNPNDRPVSEQEYQHVRVYVGSVYAAPRHITLGVRIQPPNGQEYVSWSGGSGDRHFSVTVAVSASREPFEPDIQANEMYYIVPQDFVESCVHARGGKDTWDHAEAVAYPEFTEWSRWTFRKSARAGSFVAYNIYHPDLCLWAPSNGRDGNIRVGHYKDSEADAFTFKPERAGLHPKYGAYYRLVYSADNSRHCVSMFGPPNRNSGGAWLYMRTQDAPAEGGGACHQTWYLMKATKPQH